MSDSRLGNGCCLCGKVRFSVPQMRQKMGACHCKMCRKWGGGPLLSVHCGSTVTFTGEEHIATYRSSDWAVRGFCKHCGSHLFFRLKEAQYFMPIGLFEHVNTIAFEHQIFIDEKPGYYCFADKTEQMTGAQAFAKYGA